MILPELVDFSSCMLLPAGASLTNGANGAGCTPTGANGAATVDATNQQLVAAAHASGLYNFTTLLPAACPRIVYGYPSYNAAGTTLTPTSLATTLATNLTPTLPPTLTLPHQHNTVAASFQARLASSLAATQNGANQSLLQATSFHGSHPLATLSNHQSNAMMSHFRGGFSKHGFSHRVGMKRKSEDGSENEASRKDALSDLMQPLYCKLCKVILNAPAQAKQHYEGKNHVRKLKMYMEGQEETEEESQVSSTTSTSGTEDGTKSGESTPSTSPSNTKPAPSNGKPSPSSGPSNRSITPVPTNTDPIDPEIYCQMCSVSFNSIKQSRQHYNGKNHAKRARAIKSEANGTLKKPGFHKKYGPFSCHTCRLQCSNQLELEQHCALMRHVPHINHHHSPAHLSLTAQQVLTARWQTPAALHNTLLGLNGDFTKTSLHYGGGYLNNNGPPLTKKPRHLSSHNTEFTNYRLPSGKYYCSMCNQTMNNDLQMAKHMESKKHKTTFTEMKTEQEVAAIAVANST